jgi:hypothetical protein
MLVTLAATCAAFARVQTPDGPWTEVVSPHFVVFGNAYEDHLEDAAQRLEAFSALMAAEGLPWSGDDGPRTDVFAFKDERTFSTFAGKVRRHGWYLGGYYTTRAYVPRIVLNLGQPDPLHTLLHEAVHDALDRRYPNLPRWLSEGYAETYSMFELEGASATVVRNVDQARNLRRSPKISLDLLFSIPDDTKDPRLLGPLYAWSWGFVYYATIARPEYAPKLARFVGLLNARRPVRPAYQEAFGSTYDVLEKELATYFGEGGDDTKLIPEAVVVVPARGHADSVPEAGVLLRLADLLLGGDSGDVALADKYLAALKRDDAANPRAGALAARSLAAHGKRRAADDAYAKAIGAGVDDPKTLLCAASNVVELVRSGMGGTTRKVDELVSRVVRSRDYLKRVLTEYPDYEPAWELLGWTYAGGDGDASAGVSALKRADAMQPLGAESLEVLVWLLVQSGHKDEAWRIVDDRLVPLGDPGVVARVQQWLVTLDDSKP